MIPNSYRQFGVKSVLLLWVASAAYPTTCVAAQQVTKARQHNTPPFLSYYSRANERALDFKHTASRKEFWGFCVGLLIRGAPAIMFLRGCHELECLEEELSSACETHQGAGPFQVNFSFSAAAMLYLLAQLLPVPALLVRRYADTGQPKWWWVLLPLSVGARSLIKGSSRDIPVWGTLIGFGLVLGLFPSKKVSR